MTDTEDTNLNAVIPIFIDLDTLSTKKSVFNCLHSKWETLSTKKGVLNCLICKRDSLTTKKGVFRYLVLDCEEGSDGQGPEKAKDHKCQLSADASCENAALPVVAARQHNTGERAVFVQNMRPSTIKKVELA
ncbi:hypothetical protein HAX54_036810 [Datura stramonium]|uniref:Uncharacterized protein n=1 Tax=Datura stramonium TaxID=4076 RepID=A0ABS8RMU6_DATST|nr:hypothetical protein [Datura stramonium]